MQVIMVETKTDTLKPTMKVLSAIEDIPINSVLSAKADGEFNYLAYNRTGFSFTESQAYTLNGWGKLRTDFPALNYFIDRMNQTEFNSAEMLCELYAIDNFRPVNLPTFLHFIKGKPPQLDKIFIGLFEIFSLNGNPFTGSYFNRMDFLSNIVQRQTSPNPATPAHVLPFQRADRASDIYAFWNAYVKGYRYEGVVVHTNMEVYKCKPVHDLDAVIIGINKKSGYGKGNLFAQQLVTSLKLALMTEQGEFVEVGDCASGIDHNLRRTLWKLMDYKVGEDDKSVYVKPLVIAKIEYTDIFKGRNKTFYLTLEGYKETGTMPLVRFKSPRLIGFRKDKQVSPQDLSIQQIPEEYLVEESA